MESSCSDDEAGESSAQRQSQMDRLAWEEAFYRFVNNLSEEDYRFMRDNNLLGTAGESTEEELLRRLQQIREDPPQELGGGNSSENVSSGESIIDWLTIFSQTENITEREQGDDQYWASANTNNSSSSDFGYSGGMNFNLHNRSPDGDNRHLSYARLLEGEYMENRQRHMEISPSESTNSMSSRSERNAIEEITEFSPTRDQRRERSRSVETRRTRSRSETSSPPNIIQEIFSRLHYYMSPDSFEHIRENEPDMFARIQQSGALREQMTRFGLQSQDHLSVSSRNVLPEEHSVDTTVNNESEEFTPQNPTTPENRHSQVENLPSASTITRLSGSEGNANEALMEVPPTRGQKRERSRSPETRRTRPRIESSSPSNRFHEMLMRFHYYISPETFEYIQENEPELFSRMQQSGALREQIAISELQSQYLLPASSRNAFPEEHSSDTTSNNESEVLRPRYPTTQENRQRQVENSPSESTATRPSRSQRSANEELIEVPPTRGQRRERSRSPETRRTRPRVESSSPPDRFHETLWRFHYYISPETFQYIRENESEMFARMQQSGALREQISSPELQSQTLLSDPLMRNAFPQEHSPDTTGNSAAMCFDHEVTNDPGEYSLSDSIASRTHLISETSNNTVSSESYQEELRNRFSHSEQEGMRSSISTIRIPVHGISNTVLNDTMPTATERALWNIMAGVGETSNAMDNESESESSSSPLSPHMERAESQNGYDSFGSSISNSNSDTSSDSHSSSSTTSSSSSSSDMSRSSSSTSFISSSSSENSEYISVMFEGNNEANIPSSSPSQLLQESQYSTPTSSDESDSGPFLAQFFNLNEEHNHPTGLTKQQIDNLAVRTFRKGDALKSCCICITEYTEGNKIRILPCSHEYHIHCIDCWLSENCTCPICRRDLSDS